MKRIVFIVLPFVLLALSCAPSLPPSPPQPLPILSIKEFQTTILNEMDAIKRKPFEDQYRKFVEKIPEGVILTTMFGDILEANPAYQDSLGYTLEELRNLTCQKITPAKWHEKEKQTVAEAVGKEYVTFKKEYIKKDGTVCPVGVTGWIIKDKKGNPIGTGSIVKPLSE